MWDFVLQAGSAFGLFYGLWQMGNGRLRGPVIAGISEAATFTVGVEHGVWSLWLIGLVLFFVQVRNVSKWIDEGVKW